MPEPTHVHTAQVLEVHDGDTFSALINLDFYVRFEAKVRVHDLYCAELTEPDGPAAASAAKGLIPVGSTVTLQSHKDEQSFQRWVCDVWLPDGRSFADVMTAAGYNGKGRGT